MLSETRIFQCTECSHAPFDTRIKLNKQASSRHRKAPNFHFNGVFYPLITTDNDKYACPMCKTETALISNLRRHMGQNCGRNQDDPFEGSEPIEEPENDHGAIGINETAPLATSRDVSTISSIGDLGFVIEAMWQVAICTHCKFVVDKALFIDHLKLKHGLDNPNEDAILHVVRQYALRPHLAIIWDETTENERSEAIPVQDGFKCEACEQRLGHICVKTKEGMRTHYKRHHLDQTSQLLFVQVTETQSTDMAPLSAFAIPENIHSVPGHNSTVVERKELNQFGVKFQGYALLEIVDLSVLGNFLHNPQDESFELHKKLSLRMLEASREDTMAQTLKSRAGITVMLQQFDVVNRVLPSGESGVSQYLIPRAINLLSLRRNGSCQDQGRTRRPMTPS
ncbi:hypothetical protein V1527DRAFT_499416 [Lipomyces starkeyi]